MVFDSGGTQAQQRIRAIFWLCSLVASVAHGASEISRWRSGETPYAHDFSAFYTASGLVRTGAVDRLYDLDAQRQWYVANVGPAPTASTHWFLSPPHFALLLTPVSLLPYWVAATLWMLINFVAGYWAMCRLVELKPGSDSSLRLLVFYPLWANVWAGQTAGLFLLGYSHFYTAWRRGQGGGLAVGLLALKPHLALLPFLSMLWARRYREVTVSVLIALVPVALAGAVFGRDLLPLTLASRERIAWFHNGQQESWGELSVLSFVRRFFFEAAPNFANTAGIVVSLLLLTVAVKRMQSEKTEVRGGALMLGLLGSMHLFLYETLLLFPGIVDVVRKDVTRAGFPTLLIGIGLTFGAAISANIAEALGVLSFPHLGTLALLIVVLLLFAPGGKLPSRSDHSVSSSDV